MPKTQLEGMKLRDRFIYLAAWYAGGVPHKFGEVYKRVKARRMRLDRQNKPDSLLMQERRDEQQLDKTRHNQCC